MNTFRLYFLRQFANAVQKALSTPVDVQQANTLNTILLELDHAKTAGDSSEQLTQLTEDTTKHHHVIDVIDIPNDHTPLALEISESAEMVLTQPIIWQDFIQNNPAAMEEEDALLNHSKEASTDDIQQNIKAKWKTQGSIISTKTAASFFPSLPWLKNELSINLTSESSTNTIKHLNQFEDPWDIQTAQTFFQNISWNDPNSSISITAADGAPSAVIEPTILKNQFQQGQHPVLDFFGALPWNGKVH